VPERSRRVLTRVTRQGIELRVDGTLASLIQPGRAGTGPVWDALAAPLLALPRARLRHILVLGFGGGSVARVARALAPQAEIVGVELDRDVIREARRHFGLRALGAEIVIADAVEWLRRERRHFDAIVDDVYEGRVQHLRKPAALVENYDLVHRRLARGGLLVVNTIGETARMARRLSARPGTLLRLSPTEYWNHILALGPATLRAPVLRERLRREPLFAASLEQFQLRTLRP
jgi:predicted membrane-bound spermidine synthase